MYGSQYFKYLRGSYDHHGMLQFPATLALNTADDDTGVVRIGKPMAYLSTDLTKMRYAIVSDFLGFIMHQVNAYGPKNDAGFKSVAIGKTQLPLSRGQNISLRQPLPGFECEIEGEPTTAAAIETLIATSGTGAITAATAYGVELGFVTPGCLRVAQATDLVFAKMLKADMTPETASNIRIRITFVSPYVK